MFEQIALDGPGEHVANLLLVPEVEAPVDFLTVARSNAAALERIAADAGRG
ncbi:MAG: hypothetical protein IIA30_04715 [Myxococcales bacterium]|nr:hypothetical protein [Myxococcales bacterium]